MNDHERLFRGSQIKPVKYPSYNSIWCFADEWCNTLNILRVSLTPLDILELIKKLQTSIIRDSTGMRGSISCPEQ